MVTMTSTTGVAATAAAAGVPTWLWVVGSAVALLISSGLAGQLLTAGVARLRETAAVRRDRYADAVELVVARIEYPYRIRRRIDDNPATLAALAERGHNLQERLARTQAWVATESPAVAEVFDACVQDIDVPFKAACRQAWEAAPISTAAQMNLNGFGLGNQQDLVDNLERATAYRFGARRLLPEKALRQRLRKVGCLPSPGSRPPVGEGPDRLMEPPLREISANRCLDSHQRLSGRADA